MLASRFRLRNFEQVSISETSKTHSNIEPPAEIVDSTDVFMHVSFGSRISANTNNDKNLS